MVVVDAGCVVKSSDKIGVYLDTQNYFSASDQLGCWVVGIKKYFVACRIVRLRPVAGMIWNLRKLYCCRTNEDPFFDAGFRWRYGREFVPRTRLRNVVLRAVPPLSIAQGILRVC